MDPISSTHRAFDWNREVELDPTLVLPPEILVNIFSFLPLKNVLKVNRRWCEITIKLANDRNLDAHFKKIRNLTHTMIETEKSQHPISYSEQSCEISITPFIVTDVPHLPSEPNREEKRKFVAESREFLQKNLNDIDRYREELYKLNEYVWRDCSFDEKLDIMLHRAGQFFYQSFLAVKSFFIRSCKFVYHFLL